MKRDYTKLDDAICLCIDKWVGVTLSELTQTLGAVAKKYQTYTTNWPTPPDRILSRRLQSLKKAGTISYDGDRWRRVDGGYAGRNHEGAVGSVDEGRW